METIKDRLSDLQPHTCTCPTDTHEISESHILYWAKLILEEKFKRSNYLTSPDCTREFLKLLFSDKSHEEFVMIFLDNQHAVIGHEVLFRGTIDAASVYPREVVKATLAHEAAAVILSHNHPSGVSDPSEADKNITSRIINSLNTIDVKVLDHLVVGGTSITSFAERGLI